MTITIRKLHLAIVVLAVAMLAPATAAIAFHVFDDVPDDAFYADAVEWAADNDITTGRSPTIFDPLASVTRGESVTFAKRYDDNVVQPALTNLQGDVAAKADSAAVYTKAQVDAAVGAAELGTASIASGTTVTGYILWDGAVTPDFQVVLAVDLPGRAPQDLTDTTVNFGADEQTDDDDDDDCTGTSTAPTAPPGKVCIYVHNTEGFVVSFFGRSAPIDSFKDRVFEAAFGVEGTVGDRGFIRATWAYTAP